MKFGLRDRLSRAVIQLPTKMTSHLGRGVHQRRIERDPCRHATCLNAKPPHSEQPFVSGSAPDCSLPPHIYSEGTRDDSPTCTNWSLSGQMGLGHCSATWRDMAKLFEDHAPGCVVMPHTKFGDNQTTLKIFVGEVSPGRSGPCVGLHSGRGGASPRRGFTDLGV